MATAVFQMPIGDALESLKRDSFFVFGEMAVEGDDWQTRVTGSVGVVMIAIGCLGDDGFESLVSYDRN